MADVDFSGLFGAQVVAKAPALIRIDRKVRDSCVRVS